MIGVDVACDVDGNRGWNRFSRVFSNSHFFSFLGSASETGRDMLSCASLTRTLRATSEDMALMICVLHCSV